MSDYTTDGMKEAQSRYGGSMDLQEYFHGRDYKSEIAPYVAPEPETRDTGSLKPAQIRGLKMFTISGSVVTAWVGFLEVCASGAMNTVFQVAACGFVLMFLVSGMFGGSHTEKSYSSKGGDNIVVNNTTNIQR